MGAGIGCANLHRTPDRCGYSLDNCHVIRELDCILDCECPIWSAYCSEDCDGEACPTDAPCQPACSVLGCMAGCKKCKEAGPPPIPYKPPMPPKFLLVPARPAETGVPCDAPVEAWGSMEWGYRNEVLFPARD